MQQWLNILSLKVKSDFFHGICFVILCYNVLSYKAYLDCKYALSNKVYLS